MPKISRLIKMQCLSELKISDMFDINKIVRENVKRHKAYSSARDDFKGKKGIFLDANESPFGNLNRYPDPYQVQLKSIISNIKGVSEDSIFLGNGSDEIIDLAFRIFCNPGKDKVLVFPPTYGMYEVTASVNDILPVKVPLDSDFQINMQEVKPLLKDKALKLIFICSPNNPTGNSMNNRDIEYLINNFHGVVLIDEAYSDFSDKPSFIDRTASFPNLIVMQTFSKAMGLAAARIGMAFSDPSVIKYFNRIKPPYNISTINQKAALGKLINNGIMHKHVRLIKAERERLAYELKKIPVIQKIFPSDANFLLVKVPDADGIYQYLISKGVIVRNRSSAVNNCVRITIGTKSENDQLLDALKSNVL
jgi:histidinol-phosphate aminotransferase